jgi:tRNA(Ile)-lysidine synthase
MTADALTTALARVPAGRWAVAVSGGADSVALLRLAAARSELQLHVVHVDHQTRNGASTADAAFVADLAAKLGLPCFTTTREALEPSLRDPPNNLSARFRALRLAHFRHVVSEHRLRGVLLAHHADDQAETIFHRLLRGSSPFGLAGMHARTTIGGLTLVRPLLAVRRTELRAFLASIEQDWREDESNRSPKYLRNRIRAMLNDHAALVEPLLSLGKACAALRRQVKRSLPPLEAELSVSRLRGLPTLTGREAARRWLVARGAPPGDLPTAALDRLLTMATDAASPPRCDFPGGLRVRRRGGMLFVEPALESPNDAHASRDPKGADEDHAQSDQC